MEPAPPSEAPRERRFPCAQCGARLVFAPGTEELRCEYCGIRNAIPSAEREIEELDYRSHLRAVQAAGETEDRNTIRCESCGAETLEPAGAIALRCAWCGADIVTLARSRRLLKPRSLLPFSVNRDGALAAYRKWVGKLWWAPGDLRRYAETRGALRGVYLPYWTYDAGASTRYTGMRGTHYWDTETYTAMGSDGQPTTRTRQVQRTDWSPVSGRVEDAFDDLLVAASTSMPKKLMEQLTPWDLQNLVPYTDAYLAGFEAESYQLSLAEGFAEARAIMDAQIRESVRADIGGDEQRVQSVDTSFRDITFKYLLLPIWVVAWRYRGSVYRSLVNARTGEVRGERPYSTAKIASAVLLLVAVIVTVVLVLS